MRRSVVNFAIFFVGVMVVMAGAMFWLSVRDYDQHYYFETSYDQQPPNYRGDSAYYEELPTRQREIVDGAIAGRNYQFGEDAAVPPPLVRKGDTYYKFVSFRTFDWSDPGMVLSVVIVLAGALITLEGIRREQFPHTDLADVKYHLPFIGGK